MLEMVALLVGGLVLLVLGGEALVRGASSLALLARVTPAVVGLTIVAAGTSAPELVVSMGSAFTGRTEVAVGNVVGSNIFNIGAILGIAALVRPLRIEGQSVKLEWPVMFLAACLLHLLSRDGKLDAVEGSFLLAGYAIFIAYMVWTARVAVTSRERDEFEGEVGKILLGGGAKAWAASAGLTAVSIAVLALGADLFVDGAVELASTLGVSTTVIGLTVVAAGTSLPELVTSLVAAYRGHDDIAVGNVIGSNIFNVMAIAGPTAILHPLPIPGEVLDRDNLWMVGLSALLLPLMRSGLRVNRIEGAVLLLAFGAYLFTLFAANGTVGP
jgi:cation:H+ antiporter